MEALKRIAVEWTFDDEAIRWSAFIADVQIGQVAVNIDGKFKARHRGAWLSSSTVEDYVPFACLADAKRALLLAEGIRLESEESTSESSLSELVEKFVGGLR